MWAEVDDEDLPLVSGYTWYVKDWTKSNTCYAQATVRRPNNPSGRGTMQMHVLLTGWPRTDHIDGNGLNNQRANLRPATLAQNQYNKRSLGGRSAFKGVHWQQGAWVARISKNGVRLHLGRFPTEVEAALAYDQAAREHHGEFARLNNPLGTDHR